MQNHQSQGSPEESAYIRGGTQREQYSDDDVVIWSCPLCGSSDEVHIATERGVLRVVQCRGCDLIRVNPRLKDPEGVYQGNADVYREEFRLVVSGAKPHHRDDNYRNDLNLIARYKPTGRFLDIGTNAGSFLRLARNRGWELQGVEPSPQLGALAREWWGLEILEGFLEQLHLPEQHYDIVTMTDVFEHVVNPREMLQAVHRVLKSDGVLFIKVPNGRYNLLKHNVRKAMGNTNADNFDAYEHVCHYTHETLVKMVQSCGFDVLEVRAGEPIQLPVWHTMVGHYYQHASPWSLSWKTNTARALMYQAARLETALTRHVGWLAPSVTCIARPSQR